MWMPLRKTLQYLHAAWISEGVITEWRSVTEDEAAEAQSLYNYDEYEQEEIADSYRKELEAGEESDKGYHEFLQGMADREIISLYENYGIVTNIKIEGWEPASR